MFNNTAGAINEHQYQTEQGILSTNIVREKSYFFNSVLLFYFQHQWDEEGDGAKRGTGQRGDQKKERRKKK